MRQIHDYEKEYADCPTVLKNIYYEYHENPALGQPHHVGPFVHCDVAAALEREVISLRAFKRNVDEALNSGDGTYRP